MADVGAVPAYRRKQPQWTAVKTYCFVNMPSGNYGVITVTLPLPKFAT